jgi:S-adenosyl methyltransferase
VPEFDPRTPSIARVYDYLLGGKDNFAVDREVGDRLLAVFPPAVDIVPENRQFLARAVTWVANQGVAQGHNYPPAEFATLFDGMELVPPGVVDGRQWHPGWSDLPTVPVRDGQAISGVARIA